MELIIDIPEEIVMAIHNGKDYRYDIHTAIAQGIPYEPKGDLISREALKEALKSNCKPEICHDYGTNWCEACCPHNDFEDLIDNAPTVDIWQLRQEATENALKKAEVLYGRPKGEWIEENSETGALGIKYTWFRCNQCGWENSLVIPRNFCPNCGADMQKGGAE